MHFRYLVDSLSLMAYWEVLLVYLARSKATVNKVLIIIIVVIIKLTVKLYQKKPWRKTSCSKTCTEIRADFLFSIFITWEIICPTIVTNLAYFSQCSISIPPENVRKPGVIEMKLWAKMG